MRIYLTTLFIALTSYIFAQPFLDIVNIRISGFQGNSPFVESDKPIKQQNTCNASLNLPLFIDSANLILLSPGYEIRNLQENEFTHYLFEGFDFPVTYVHTFSLANARISATILPRYAGCDGIAWNTNSMLLGGAG